MKFVEKGWSGEASIVEVVPQGLVLQSGELLRVEFVESMPIESEVLKNAVISGVEVDSDGRIWSTMKIWDWCGVRPKGSDHARVDLSSLCLIAGGSPVQDLPSGGIEFLSSNELTLRVDEELGLNVSDFLKVLELSEVLWGSWGSIDAQ